MAERTGGARALLSHPRAYSLLMWVVGSSSFRRALVSQYLRVRPGDRVLDIGCGPADILDLMPDVRYVGIDSNPTYIEAARRRYGDRAEFHCVDAQEADLPAESFDVVSVIALLHHLDDDDAETVFKRASGALVDSGRMVTLDNALREGQSRLARWMIERDRGASVRKTDGYARLAEPYFESVRRTTREDLLRIPYTHAILECERPRRGAVRPGPGG
jgi:SAM-dependent methyltransferase